MRAVALGLLVLAAVVYVLTLHADGGWGYLNSAAEAGMVGALADWFAVTALFRHPLGLPIPHTAIIPTRKDALGLSLQDFVTEHFLTEDVVRARVASAQLSGRLAGWVLADGHADTVVDEAAKHAAKALSLLKDEDIRSFVDSALLPRLGREQLSPLAGHLLESVVDDGAHHGLVDLVLVEIHDWMTENSDAVAKVIGARAPWWSPRWMDDIVVDRVHREVIGWVTEVRDHADHPARAALDRMLRQLADDLQNDPPTMVRAEALKLRLLDHPQTARTVVAVADAVRRALLGALADPNGLVRRRATEALTDYARRIQADRELQERLDGMAGDMLAYVVRSYGKDIAPVISETVNRWDGREAAARIELHVGRDLQFIRINGTVVGALAGLVIHTLSQLL